MKFKKDPLLTAAVIKHSIGHVEDPRAQGVIAAIERGVKLHDSLHKLRTAENPNQTKEALALSYKRAHAKATLEINQAAAQHVETLTDWRKMVIRRAETEAGFHSPLAEAHAAEIRATLRSMTQEDRDAAVTEAAKRGDTAVIQAIRKSPSPVLTGPVTGQLAALTDSMMKQADPELEPTLQIIDTALGQLSSFHKRFTRSVDEMRLHHSEEAAETQEREYNAAMEAIG